MTQAAIRLSSSALAAPRRAALGLAMVAAAVIAACGPTGEKLLTRAEQSAAAGDHRAAMIDLQNYLTKHPDDAAVRARLAVVLTDLEQWDEARVAVARAKELGATADATVLADCRLLLVAQQLEQVLDDCSIENREPELAGQLATTRGHAELGLGRIEQARDSFAIALAADAANLEAIAGAAQAAYRLDGLPAARALFESAPDSIRTRSAYWNSLAFLESRAGDLSGAELSYTTAIEKSAPGEDNRERLGAFLGLSDVQARLGKLDQAAATADKMVAEFPKVPAVKLVRAMIARKQGDADLARRLLDESAQAVANTDLEDFKLKIEYELGLVMEDQGNLNQAITHLSRVVARRPNDFEAQQQLARLRARVLSPEASIEGLQQTLQDPDADPSMAVLASQLYLQSGDREKALEFLIRAEASKESTPEAQVNIASGYIALGELDRAVEILDAVPSGSSQVELRRDALRLATLLQQGKIDEAVQRADTLIQESADKRTARAIAAGVFLRARQYALAEAQYARLVAEQPADADARLRLAAVQLLQKKIEPAAQQFSAILARDPANLRATLGMLVVAREQRDAAQAEKWARKAVADHPQSAEAHVALAQHLLTSGKPQDAVAAATRAVELEPRKAAVISTLGIAQAYAGDHAASLRTLRSAADAEPEVSGYRLNLARAYARNRQIPEALDVIDDVLRRDPKSTAAAAAGVTLSLQSGSIERASKYLASLSAHAPDSDVALRAAGDVAMAQKRYADAAGYYAKLDALGDAPWLVAARYQAERLSGARDAQKVLTDWLASHPEDTGVRLLYAEHLDRSGDAVRAAREYETILERKPDNVVALNNLAVLYQKSRNPRAEQLARAAFDAAPDNPLVADTYGWLLVEKGELGQAVEILRKAANHPATSAEIQYHYAEALARKGDRDAAVEVLRKITGTGVDPQVRTDAGRLLAELEK
jgi:putative PEP-CTERM system TPR-repeat lipoprotein